MKNAILLYSHSEKPERDGLGGPYIAFTYDVQKEFPNTYIDQFPFFVDKLRSAETIEHIVKERCLIDDKFEGDQSFRFENVEYKNLGIVYTFKNSEGTELEVRFEIETIIVI